MYYVIYSVNKYVVEQMYCIYIQLMYLCYHYNILLYKIEINHLKMYVLLPP
jgi:hypothetical protein